MMNPGIVYLLLCLALLATAIVIHILNSNFVLPIAPLVSFLPILLPVIGAINAICYPRQLFNASRSLSRAEKLFPNIIQSLQFILTTVLAVLLFQSAITGVGLNCGLSTSWQHMFATKNEDSIRRIQDSFNCCGFNSVKDRAWPFRGEVRCAQRYGRDLPCVGPWREATLRNSRVDLGVVLGAGVLQIFILLFTQSASNWRHAWWAQGWSNLSERPIEELDRSRRPLITAAPVAGAGADQTESVDDSDDMPISFPNLGSHYGTIDERSEGRTRSGSIGRIEPSSMENVWNAGSAEP